MYFCFYRIISENNGTPPLTFQRFHSILAELDPPARPQDPITTVTIDSAKTPTTEKHDAEYGVPTLEQLGKLYHCTGLDNQSLT